MSDVLICGDRQVDLGAPRVMGILNVTPDSFSDGGDFFSVDKAVARALEMQAQGAAIIDIGGESTRPGAGSVPESEELDRVVPVIGALAPRLRVPMSIDTSKPAVMRAAVAAGASMINDVRALRHDGALEAAREAAVPVCLMHMQGEPRTMQVAPRYGDVVREVLEFLSARVAVCVRGGIGAGRLLVDPGFGFGKTLEDNFAILNGLHILQGLKLPILVGISRKRMLGAVTGAPEGGRVHAGVAAAVIAAMHGARIIRTHDVRQTVEALAVVQATLALRSDREGAGVQGNLREVGG